MLDITGNDISELNDTDLRSLIGLLCEAELFSAGLPTAGVTWGGHQNAKDGGIDVRVNISSSLQEDSFIPRAKTGFQVKKPDMPASSIIAEMCPEGELRKVIMDLADNKGAYIIISSQGSTSDSALMSRRAAMQEAISGYPNSNSIKVDFYDRERVASWVRSYPALILWVRNKIGKPIQGWMPYGNWAKTPKDVDEKYFLDEHVCLYNNSNKNDRGLTALEGISQLRTVLHRPSSSVRLVGLSGVGKTRLLQALFNEEIGEKPLNKSQVYYCDVGNNPNPDPCSFAQSLVALGKPAVIVIDNCPPDLHRRLNKICTDVNSLVSLITVEYDVRDDQPEETEVFRLEPASLEVIEKIIAIRFKHISKIDVSTIAKFSGGNSRIAIALANTVLRGENLSNLRDEDLFVRLFHQRNNPDNSLLRAAQVCSLVYSFDIRTAESEGSELGLLASLIGMSELDLYENISELKRRDLVQQRGIWRAVLPHAIANKLAKRALESIPLDKIYATFEKKGSDRILKSFSRRLSYLHESEAAVDVSKRWLSESGLLGDVYNLNELGISLLINIAPVNPKLVLSAVERILEHEEHELFFSRKNSYYSEFTRLLRNIAYDKDLFSQSAYLLCRFALSEKPGENYNSIRNLLKSLFYIFFSGTHATVDQRLDIIDDLMTSSSNEKVELGLSLLSAALQTGHFSLTGGFEFGAHSRDYGYTPDNREAIRGWFKTFIEYSVELATVKEDLASKIKKLLAEKFSGLWAEAKMYDELEAAARNISNKYSWSEGWISIRTTKRYYKDKMDSDTINRLNSIEALLNPTTLIERARLYIFSGKGSALDLVDAIGNEDETAIDGYTLAEEITRDIGRNIAKEDDILKELLPDIISKEGPGLFVFGQGLGEGTTEPEKMWQDFCVQLSLTERTTRKYMVLGGFLKSLAKINKSLSEKLLDLSVTDPIVSAAYPLLQIDAGIDDQAIERLKESLQFGDAPIHSYINLAYGRVHESIHDDELCELLRLIASKENGLEVAIEILRMRLHRDSKDILPSESIISLGQELIVEYQFSRENNRHNSIDYDLAKIIKECFIGKSAENSAKVVCEKIVAGFAQYNLYSMDYQDVMRALAKTQPKVFLDAFLENSVENDYFINHIFSTGIREDTNPISCIDDEVIIDWCDLNPDTRYPILSSAITPYRKEEKDGLLGWTPLALRIINTYKNPIIVLDKFKSSFTPSSWSGSRADEMQNCLCLIEYLKNSDNTLVKEWAKNEEKVFKKEIQATREWESRMENERNERFE